MKTMAFFMSILPLVAQANIFGRDDRIDTIHASAVAQNLAPSLPALVPNSRVKGLPNGDYELTGSDLPKMGLCSDESFADEPSIANCSASLIAPDKVLTAAHCFNEDTYACPNYKLIFDYARPEIPFKKTYTMKKDQVYSCKKILHSKFDMFGEDLAVIQLDRPVEGRTPVELILDYPFSVGEPLIMIGYPLGISQKAVEDGKVTSVNRREFSFRHNLDTFSVNSGGPIFNQKGIQVGVLVRGTGTNFDSNPNKSCLGWGKAGPKDYAEANDLRGIKGKF